MHSSGKQNSIREEIGIKDKNTTKIKKNNRYTVYVLPVTRVILYLPRVDRAVLDSSRCFPALAG